MNLTLNYINGAINGNITLEGSKSISNRLLILQALCDEGFDIVNLSLSDDTSTLNRLLKEDAVICDVGAAGTTMRFLTAYYAIGNKVKTLTGSERMKQRPIKILVDALNQLGAKIVYEENIGFPPIQIVGQQVEGGALTIRADVSSQYISALLMIAPVLQKGLILNLDGKISSLPYINMTLKTMETLGIQYGFSGNTISVFPGKYRGKTMQAESDWSAASYWFAVCALSKNSVLHINGLFEDSLQGDSVLPAIYKHFGVQAHFENGILILKQQNVYTKHFDFDFSDCPDLAQTVAITCAALGIPAIFTGVESLKIKETDRTKALQIELSKFGVDFHEENKAWVLSGETACMSPVTIHTYEDHRMAMCFAPLAIKHESIIIENPDVVNKSYPSFWTDLSSVGFTCSIA